MYWIPLLVLLVLAIIAVAWTPVFAVILAVVFVVLFFAYVGMSRRADQKAPATPESRAAARGREEEAETRIR
jgi:uncharacterized membrane protein